MRAAHSSRAHVYLLGEQELRAAGAAGEGGEVGAEALGDLAVDLAQVLDGSLLGEGIGADGWIGLHLGLQLAELGDLLLGELSLGLEGEQLLVEGVELCEEGLSLVVIFEAVAGLLEGEERLGGVHQIAELFGGLTDRVGKVGI
jgi:hypothetical protein